MLHDSSTVWSEGARVAPLRPAWVELWYHAIVQADKDAFHLLHFTF